MCKSDITPFKMHNQIYFAGSTRVSVHIIKTDAGLVMIDTGWPDMYEQILDSMKCLGLDPKNICAIFHSHGHIDHFGGTSRFVKLSGAKTYIGRADNDIVNGKLDLSWAKEAGIDRMPVFDCDVLIDDGDIFEFGNVKIRCIHTPGHTLGVISFVITINENGKEFVAAMHGGLGFNTLRSKYLDEYNLPYTVRDVYIESLHKALREKPDLVLGNHPENNDTVGKCKRALNGEDIADSTEWERMLTNIEKDLKELIEKGM